MEKPWQQQKLSCCCHPSFSTSPPALLSSLFSLLLHPNHKAKQPPDHKSKHVTHTQVRLCINCKHQGDSIQNPVLSLHPHQLWTTDDQRCQGYFWSQELILFAGFSSYCNRTTRIYREQLKQDYGSIQPTFRENVLKSRRKESHFIQRNESEAWPSPALFHIVNLRSSLLIVH